MPTVFPQKILPGNKKLKQPAKFSSNIKLNYKKTQENRKKTIKQLQREKINEKKTSEKLIFIGAT